MSVASDLNIYAAEINEDISARDRLEIDRLSNLQAEDCLAFMRLCDVYRITPVNPIPHVHDAHEDMKPKCLWAAIVANLVGAFFAISLTARGVDDHVNLLVAAALGIFVFAQAVLEVILAFIDRYRFVCAVNWLFWPGASLGIASGGLLFLARVANPSVAEVLVNIVPAAIWSLEIASLATAAVSSIGVLRFGWSGRLHRRYTRLQGEINRLTVGIERRKNAKVPAAMIQVLTLLLLAVTCVTKSHAQIPTIMLDRTGSVVEQNTIESRLTNSLSVWAPGVDRFRFMAFSEHPFSSPSIEVQMRSTTDETSVFLSLQRIQRDEAGRRIREVMNQILAVKTKMASCTSLPDIISRAILETKPVLVVTDFVDDCPNHGDLPANDGSQIVFVLVRSRFDSGSDGSAFQKKVNLLRRSLPGATVYPEFSLDDAVRSVFRRGRESQRASPVSFR